MSPAEKRNLRVDWYGLAFGWPLSNDVNGQPYFLARNDNGRHVDVSAAGLNKGAGSLVQRSGEENGQHVHR
jgi:hypothetical protein